MTYTDLICQYQVRKDFFHLICFDERLRVTKMSNDFDYDSVTIHDRLMRAWENSMELTRDFEMYSKRIPDGEVADMFKEFAEDEAMHASKLRSILENQKSQFGEDRY